MRYALLVLMVGISLGPLAAPNASAQQVTVGTPYHSLNDSFFERIGVDFDFNWGGRGGPYMTFGRPLPGGLGDPTAGTAPMRNMLDVDGGRSAVVGMLAPGVFSPDLSIPFRQNNYGSAVPQFGGYDPSAGMTSGFHVHRDGFNASLNWTAAQGYRQTFTSQTPSVTLTNGVPGYISDTSQSPFVISYIPVVGGFPTFPSPYAPMMYPVYPMGPVVQPVPVGNHRVQAMRQQMAEAARAAKENAALRRAAEAAADGLAPAPKALPQQPANVDPAVREAAPAAVRSDGPADKLAAAQASSAGQAVPSVAEAQRLRKLERAAGDNEARVLFERGRAAEEGGKANVAKVYYRMAAGRASGELHQQIQARLDALSQSSTP